MTNQFTWYGHATHGIQTGRHTLLIDPFFEGNPSTTVSAEEVSAEYILVSHGHGDHIGDALGIARRTGATVITVHEIASWFQRQGLEKVHSQHLGGGFKHPFGYLKFTLALHGSGLPDGSYGGNPCGFLLTTNDNKKAYLAQDTGLFGDMHLIGEEGLDLAVLPIGDNYTMGPADALRAVKMLKPRLVVPMHYNTFDVIKQDPHAWAERVHKETDAKAVVLKPGESLEF